jgi:hypothetical protein
VNKPKLVRKPKRKRAAKPKPNSAARLAQRRRDAKRTAFLAAFRKTASVRCAAKAARIDRTLHYIWLTEDPEYRQAFEQAREEAAQVLEDEAVRRAYNGTLKPVFYQGEKVDAVIEYSDALLMFLLKGRRPEVFRDRADIEHSGPGGGPIDFRAVKLAEILTLDELKSVRARLTAVAG